MLNYITTKHMDFFESNIDENDEILDIEWELQKFSQDIN
jgi:hypothetical protein